MATRAFLGFVVISSAQSVSFSESESSPALWVIDTTLFAGQPSLSVKTTTRRRATITSIALTSARYPGTNLPADLSLEITESPGGENQSASQDVSLKLVFGNASFDWQFEPIDTDPQTQIDPFLEWLKMRASATAPISIAGSVVAFADGGGIDFGPAASATLTLMAGAMTVEGSDVCTANVAGASFTGSSLSVSVASPAHTDLAVRATSPLSVPVPSPTPLGSLVARPGFSVVTVHASETRQSAAFSSANPAPLYVLELSEGVTDVEGRRVQVTLLSGEVDFDLSTAP